MTTGKKIQNKIKVSKTQQINLSPFLKYWKHLILLMFLGSQFYDAVWTIWIVCWEECSLAGWQTLNNSFMLRHFLEIIKNKMPLIERYIHISTTLFAWWPQENAVTPKRQDANRQNSLLLKISFYCSFLKCILKTVVKALSSVHLFNKCSLMSLMDY